MGHFFDNYRIHAQSDKAGTYLAPLVIGRLSGEEAIDARSRATADAHTASRLRVLGRARKRMLLLCVSMPFFLAGRLLLQCLQLLVPKLVEHIAAALPVSVPGVGMAVRLAQGSGAARPRVAVIGGGVAGSGCAYALSESGFEVTLYEARPTLSGNARTFDWQVGGQTVKSCVSVTAWPAPLYKNYVALLKKLEVPTQRLEPWTSRGDL